MPRLAHLRNLLLVSLTLCFVFLLATPPVARAADEYGLEATAGAAGLTKAGSDLPKLIGNVIGAALAMIGVLFFILTLYGGILWMTARGNEDQVTKAKDTIIAAVVGMAVVVASYALTKFVFQGITGTQAPGGAGAGAGGAPPADQCTQTGTGYACRDNAECDPTTIQIGPGFCLGQGTKKCCRTGTSAGPITQSRFLSAIADAQQAAGQLDGPIDDAQQLTRDLNNSVQNHASGQAIAANIESLRTAMSPLPGLGITAGAKADALEELLNQAAPAIGPPDPNFTAVQIQEATAAKEAARSRSTFEQNVYAAAQEAIRNAEATGGT